MKRSHHTPGYTDIDRYIVDVKAEVRSIRTLREEMIELLYALVEQPNRTGLLVLSDPRVTKSRLDRELNKAKKAFLPEIMKRFNIVVAKEGHCTDLPKDFKSGALTRLEQLVADEETKGDRLPRADAYYVLLKLLIHEWLVHPGPMTTNSLQEASGYSYPTVAGTLKRLGGLILRDSERRIELVDFPGSEWARLVAVSEKMRCTVRFVDRSPSPQCAIDVLVRKLNQLNRTDIAIGGVRGALHYYPALDLTGSPRLDLSIHCRGNRVNFDFVHSLDPALDKTEDPAEAARLAVHVVRYKHSFFHVESSATPYADPVECLLDLHEARLEQQAREFLNALIKLKEKTL